MVRLIIILAAVYLVFELLLTLALRCRSGNPGWKKLLGFRYAHRGLHNKPQIPENSLPAFRRAIERGYGAELDVHLLKDGTLAIFHDSKLERCTGEEGILEDLTLEEMKRLRLEGTDEQIPLFDEVLALFEGVAPLIIELKAYGGNQKALTQAVLARLASYRGDYCIESFDPLVLMEVRRLRPDIVRGQLSQSFYREKHGLSLIQQVIGTNCLLNFKTQPDFIAYKFSERSNRCVRRCIGIWGAREASWTIRTPEELAACEREGCIPIFEQFDPGPRA